MRMFMSTALIALLATPSASMAQARQPKYDPLLESWEMGGIGPDEPAPRKRAAPQAKPSATNTDWLLGYWIRQGRYCASSEPIEFQRGGKFFMAGGAAKGTWSLSGAVMTISLRGQKPGADPFRRISSTEMMLGGKRFRKCPANGSEPWYPEGGQ